MTPRFMFVSLDAQGLKCGLGLQQMLVSWSRMTSSRYMSAHENINDTITVYLTQLYCSDNHSTF